MAEGQQQNLFNAEIDIKATTTGIDKASRAIDELTRKIEDVQRKALQITSAFDKVFSGNQVSQLSGHYEKLNQQIVKYQQNLQRIGVQQTQNNIKNQQSEQKQSPSLMSMAGRSVFKGTTGLSAMSSLRNRGNNNNSVSNMGNRAAGLGRRGVGVIQGVGSGMQAANFTNALMSGLTNVTAAIPSVVGSLMETTMQGLSAVINIRRNLWKQKQAEVGTMAGVQGLSGSGRYGRNLMWQGTASGYANSELMRSQEQYLKSGGNYRSSPREQMLLARAYGIDLNSVAQTSGELERYGQGSGLSQMRNIMSIAQQSGVKRPLMQEFTQTTVQAWKQAVAQGIPIKNAKDIAEGIARFERTGARGIIAQQAYQSFRSVVAGGTGLNNPFDVRMLRGILTRNPKMSAIDALRAMKDPRQMFSIARNAMIDLYGKESWNKMSAKEQADRLYEQSGNETFLTQGTNITKAMRDERRFNRHRQVSLSQHSVREATRAIKEQKNLDSKEALVKSVSSKMMVDARAVEINSRNIILKLVSGKMSMLDAVTNITKIGRVSDAKAIVEDEQLKERMKNKNTNNMNQLDYMKMQWEELKKIRKQNESGLSQSKNQNNSSSKRG